MLMMTEWFYMRGIVADMPRVIKSPALSRATRVLSFSVLSLSILFTSHVFWLKEIEYALIYAMISDCTEGYHKVQKQEMLF